MSLLDGIVAYPSQAAPKGCAAAYSLGVSRLFNQACFGTIYVHDDGEVSHDLTEPFKILLDPRLSMELTAGLRKQGRQASRLAGRRRLVV